MRVLAVAAHPDDEVLGCGATLAKHALDGDEVHVLILGKGRPGAESDLAGYKAAEVLGVRVSFYDLPDNQFDFLPMLDIVRLVEGSVSVVRPEVVYTHSLADLNVDHRCTHEAVLTACRPQDFCSVQRILAFEVPSSTEWGMGQFIPAVFVDVDGEPYKRKCQALQCYAAEMRDSPHPRSFLAVAALATWRGSTAGVRVAEAFELVREVR